jgi:hypothetical protein
MEVAVSCNTFLKETLIIHSFRKYLSVNYQVAGSGKGRCAGGRGLHFPYPFCLSSFPKESDSDCHIDGAVWTHEIVTLLYTLDLPKLEKDKMCH